MDIHQIVIKKYFEEGEDCKRYIIDDGISTKRFSIKKNNRIWEDLSIMIQEHYEKHKFLKKSLSLMKNIDDYQFLICKELPDIPDTEKYKLELQKYRIILILLFKEFIEILKSQRADKVENWNNYTKNVIQIVSEIWIKKNKYTSKPKGKDNLTYEMVNENRIEAELKRVYEIEDED